MNTSGLRVPQVKCFKVLLTVRRVKCKKQKLKYGTKRSDRMCDAPHVILAQTETTTEEEEGKKSNAALPRTGDSYPETSTGMLGKVVLCPP